MNTIDLSKKAADTIRVLSASMVEKANSGHPGGPMGGADFIHILFAEYLGFDPDDMGWYLRDRFYLDPGHMSSMLYSVQHLLGSYSTDDIKNFRQWGSPTPGHPELDVERGIENTSGPLGLGHAFGAGSSIAERFMQARFGDAVSHRTYIYISDGGIQEEISQGVGRIAGTLGLGQITMFYDANDIQLSTTVDEVTSEDTALKYTAWGWHVVTIDGNDHTAIRKALDACIEETNKPSLIIGKTIMGKGVVKEDDSNFEGEVELHGQPLGKSNASYEATMKGLNANMQDPFEVSSEVKEYYDYILDQKRADAATKRQQFDDWAQANEALALKYDSFMQGDSPVINWEGIVQKENTATRNNSGVILAHLAENVENVIVSSADLSNSDKTEFFLKKSSAFSHHDFSGAFLQAGVSELTMAALCTGMGLHGGVIPVCATFFAFSDYMKPAIRVAALMETQVIFIWTHDAFRVGEDGPTHQPVEQETQIRLMEKLKNHSGENSFLALRPADGAETTVAWKMCLENTGSPSGLILSRQNVKDIATAGNRFDEALEAEKGGYIVLDCEGTPDVVLVANGSEVATLFEGVELLKTKTSKKLRIVSVPSEGVFRNQSATYQESIIPTSALKFGLTAGLSVNMLGLVGTAGTIHGVNHFGYSAPYTVLDEKFGFTGENVCKMVLEMIG